MMCAMGNCLCLYSIVRFMVPHFYCRPIEIMMMPAVEGKSVLLTQWQVAGLMYSARAD